MGKMRQSVVLFSGSEILFTNESCMKSLNRKTGTKWMGHISNSEKSYHEAYGTLHDGLHFRVSADVNQRAASRAGFTNSRKRFTTFHEYSRNFRHIKSKGKVSVLN
jgi:hypothetical protein